MRILVSLVLSVLLAGCGNDVPSLQGTLESGPAYAGMSDLDSRREVAVERPAVSEPFGERLRALAPPETSVVRSIAAGASRPFGVLVTYRPASAARAAECTLTIAEEREAQLVPVGTSADMLQCSAAPSREAVEAALQTRVDDEVIELKQTGPHGETHFTLVRTGADEWRVKTAHFSFVETDPETGTVEAIIESVLYQDVADMPNVSDYQYSIIKSDLIRQRVE